MAKTTEIFWHNLNIEKIARLLKTDVEDGLSEKEVKEKRKKLGSNKLPEDKPLPWFKTYLNQFRSPLIYILIIAGIITLALGDLKDTAIIFGAVFLNTVIGFFQENKASKILSELKKIVKIKSYVIRDGNERELEQSELVPGDIFLLNAGDRVPADGRLIKVHNLKINESSLTGEWISADKKTEVLPGDTPLADRDNMAYMGCLVEEGWGKAIVTKTGQRTEIGKVAAMVKETKEEKTPYQKKISNLSKIIGILIVFLSILIFILGTVFNRDPFEMFLTAVAVAVAAIPEGLPVAITVILALGMQRILKKQGLVRKMIAAETLGSTSIIATDKTGTLTEAKMKVDKIYPEKNNVLALKIVTLCNEAFIENPEEALERQVVRGKPTEKALLLAGMQAGLNKKDLEKDQPEIDKLPFDPVYKYSATLHRLKEKENILYVMGAPEIILAKSKFLDINGKKEKLSEIRIKELKKKIDEFTRRGQRVLAASYKKFRGQELEEAAVNDLIFVSLIALHDPLRKEVKEAIRICRSAGMKPIIVTGDHKLTAQAIAGELGLLAREENSIEGWELEKLDDEEFKKRLKDIEIYARVEPAQKLRIVRAWQEKGEVVAMTGDGINDALALKQADIGLALGSGTDVAKEASDLILLTDNFSIIVAAVE